VSVLLLRPACCLLRRVAVEPQPSGAHRQAHMSKVIDALCPRPKELFHDGEPHDARDECVRLRWVQCYLRVVQCTRRPALSWRIIRQQFYTMMMMYDVRKEKRKNIGHMVPKSVKSTTVIHFF
jgi:hypothetical protein